MNRTYEFVSLLRNTNIDYPFDRCLDIGCGYAFQPRILKGLGIVREAVGIDVYDRASAIDERQLARQHRRFLRLRVLDSIQQRVEGRAFDSQAGLKDVILDKLLPPNSRTTHKRSMGWMPDVGVFKLRFVNKPHLDRYINGDVFELEEKFDLITAFYCLPWFEAEAIFRKISDLLEPGGVFYAGAPNWWYPVNPSNLAGHFPYASQRLTKEDYFRYLDEFFPEHADVMKVWYQFYDPSHPTLSDYIAIGYKHGLIALDYKSTILPQLVDRRRGITSSGYSQLAPTELGEVLDDIHQFRPDVRLEDLLTYFHTIIFKKVDKTKGMDSVDPEELLGENAPRQISNPIARTVGKSAKRLLTGVFGR